MVNINFENLGSIKSGNIDLNNLTVITGENNCGKTYLAYAIYGLLSKEFKFSIKEINPILEKLYETGKNVINLKSFCEKNFKKIEREISNYFSDGLDEIFNAVDGFFKNSKVSFSIDSEVAINNIKNEKFQFNINLGKQDNKVFLRKKKKKVLNYL